MVKSYSSSPLSLFHMEWKSETSFMTMSMVHWSIALSNGYEESLFLVLQTTFFWYRVMIVELTGLHFTLLCHSLYLGQMTDKWRSGVWMVSEVTVLSYLKYWLLTSKLKKSSVLDLVMHFSTLGFTLILGTWQLLYSLFFIWWYPDLEEYECNFK